MKTVDFYFDFSSPFGYLGSTRVEALAAKHGREVTWHPVLLGAVFKTVGTKPLVEYPLKGDYARRDFDRSARFYGIPFKRPDPFPVGTIAAARAFYSVADQAKAVRLAKALYRAYFVDGINIGEAPIVLRIAAEAGCTVDIESQAVKDRTRTEVDGAIAKGVFGSPFLIIDGEPFWGVDRFDQADRWMKGPF